MKKIGLIILVSLILTGCSGKEAAVYQEKVKLYQSYWSSILDQNKYQKSSSNFSISADIGTLEGGYQYNVIVDKPRVAMYEVEMLVIENEDPYQDVKMMPSLGIFDESVYHMIPNQVRAEKGFQKGFKLSGETTDGEITLHVLVSWKNQSRSVISKEYFELTLNHDS